MIIQGSPDILRGPRGLNGFADFGLAQFAEAGDSSGGSEIRDFAIREIEVPATMGKGINPMLILAAAAAFFIGG